MNTINEVSGALVEAAIEVHRHFGPGLLENVYEEALVHELSARGIDLERQLQVPLHYRGIRLSTSYRADLVVEGLVLVECKAATTTSAIHLAQVLTYLRLLDLRVGLLLNFGLPVMKSGIHRVINGFEAKDREGHHPSSAPLDA